MKPVCKVCKGTGRVNCILGSLKCGACSSSPLQKKVAKAMNPKSRRKP